MLFITAADLSLLVTFAQLSQYHGVPGMTLDEIQPRLETDRARQLAPLVVHSSAVPLDMRPDVRRIRRLAGLSV